MLEKIQDEARAKIFWGEDTEAVMEFLLRSGVDELQAKRVCEEALKEHRADVRADGVRKMVTGAGILGVGGILYCVARFEWVPDFAVPGSQSFSRARLPSLYQLLLVLGICGFVFGGYRLVNGMFEAASGSKG